MTTTLVRRIAIFGELRRAIRSSSRGSRARFQNDQVGRRRRLVELDRRRDAAHVDLEMGLGHAAVVAGALDRLATPRSRRMPGSRCAAPAAAPAWPRHRCRRRRRLGSSCRKPDLLIVRPYPRFRRVRSRLSTCRNRTVTGLRYSSITRSAVVGIDRASACAARADRPDWRSGRPGCSDTSSRNSRSACFRWLSRMSSGQRPHLLVCARIAA